MNTSMRARLVGSGWLLGGSLLVMGSVVFMNQQAVQPQGDDGIVGSSIKVERKEKPPATQPIAQKKPPKRKPARSAPAPSLGLGSGLAGLDFGLPAFDEDLGGDASSLLGDGDDVIMTDDSVDVAPKPLVQGPMTYPPRAKASGITGYVLLSVLIGPTGQVEKVRVLESQPAGVFDDTAVAGVQTWKFEPASYKGENVRVWAKQRVRFDLS